MKKIIKAVVTIYFSKKFRKTINLYDNINESLYDLEKWARKFKAKKFIYKIKEK